MPVADVLITLRRDGTVVAFALDGKQRWRLAPGRSHPLGVLCTKGPYLYVPREDVTTWVIDGRSGTCSPASPGRSRSCPALRSC